MIYIIYDIISVQYFLHRPSFLLFHIYTKVVLLVNAYWLTKSIYACELWLCVLCCMCAKLICMCAKLICMCDDFVPAVVDKNSLCQNYGLSPAVPQHTVLNVIFTVTRVIAVSKPPLKSFFQSVGWMAGAAQLPEQVTVAPLTAGASAPPTPRQGTGVVYGWSCLVAADYDVFFIRKNYDFS